MDWSLLALIAFASYRLGCVIQIKRDIWGFMRSAGATEKKTWYDKEPEVVKSEKPSQGAPFDSYVKENLPRNSSVTVGQYL